MHVQTIIHVLSTARDHQTGLKSGIEAGFICGSMNIRILQIVNVSPCSNYYTELPLRVQLICINICDEDMSPILKVQQYSSSNVAIQLKYVPIHLGLPNVAVLGRNWKLFCCVFWPHYHVRSYCSSPDKHNSLTVWLSVPQVYHDREQ